MENNIQDETMAKINEYRSQISDLNKKITEYEAELNKLIVKTKGDFKDSYIEYYDSEKDTFVFMHVNRQIFRKDGRLLVLCGPMLKLSDSPLRFSDDDDGFIDFGWFEDGGEITIDTMVLTDSSFDTIRKITKKEMDKVLDYYSDIVRKNLI